MLNWPRVTCSSRASIFAFWRKRKLVMRATTPVLSRPMTVMVAKRFISRIVDTDTIIAAFRPANSDSGVRLALNACRPRHAMLRSGLLNSGFRLLARASCLQLLPAKYFDRHPQLSLLWRVSEG